MARIVVKLIFASCSCRTIPGQQAVDVSRREYRTILKLELAPYTLQLKSNSDAGGCWRRLCWDMLCPGGNPSFTENVKYKFWAWIKQTCLRKSWLSGNELVHTLFFADLGGRFRFCIMTEINREQIVKFCDWKVGVFSRLGNRIYERIRIWNVSCSVYF